MVKYSLLFLILSIFCQYTVQDTVNITLYYESLCLGCEGFIRNQLYPGYQKLGQSLVIDLVPYGNAKRVLVDGKWTFTCQHGPDECFGNKMQGCVFELYPETTAQMNFLGCLTNDDNPTSVVTGKKCADKNNIEWDKIMQCLEGAKGDQIMLHNAILTEAEKDLLYVPWIVTNGDHDEDMQDKMQNNLIETVCNMLKVKPDACLKNNHAY